MFTGASQFAFVGVVAGGGAGALDARAGGLVAAIACAARKAPFLVTVTVAVVVTAGLRAWV
jgi:hypothetical protein